MIDALTTAEWLRVRAYCTGKRPHELQGTNPSVANALYRAARGLKAGSRNSNVLSDHLVTTATRLWCVKDDPKEKPVPKQLQITVAGPPMSGKSTITEIVVQALRNAGLTCDVDYGPDGLPLSPLNRRIEALQIAGPIITINQRQTNRDPNHVS